MNRKSKYKTRIGGQALIEGIMMRGVDQVSMSVRLNDGSIDNEHWNAKSSNSLWFKLPIIRGIINFIDTLILGQKCLIKSAEKVSDEQDEDFENSKKSETKTANNPIKIVSVVSIILGIALALFLFMFLPTYAIDLLSNYIPIDSYKVILEGGVKILLFVGYLACISRIKDIKRVFEYHGAEHKAISCYEDYQELTIENVKKYSRFHPRCGTSFILIVLVISIIGFSFISWDNLFIRTLLKILLLPVIVGIGYEFIKIIGRYDNWFTKLVSYPGIFLQRFTTREPDHDQIEVAINALIPVLPKNKCEDKW